MGNINERDDDSLKRGWGASRVVPDHVLEDELIAFGREVVERVRKANQALLREFQSVKPLMSVKDVAKTLKVSPRTLEKIIQSGDLEPLWVGGQRRFHPDAIDAYLRHSCGGRRPADESDK